MASYHLSAQAVKRSEGRSVIAMAAYRAGALLKDDRRGCEVDYRRRRGVAHAEILAPEGVAPWVQDRQALWNHVEQMEKRKDAQLAREINMALPHELTDAQRLALVRSFVREQFVAHGMVADFAIHVPVPEKGDDPRNFHVHVLLTLRQAGAGGLRRVKTRKWNSEAMLAKWRAAWAERQNEMLRLHGHAGRVDHRSLAVQRAAAVSRRDRIQAATLDRVPEIHVGPKARKAGQAKPPKSRDRKVGPARLYSSPLPERRTLRYPEIDRGSRGEWNIKRLANNAARLSRASMKAEMLLARLRKSQAYYERQARAVEERNPSQHIEGASLKHALQRKAQVALLIHELDCLFFALLGIRESQLMRGTIWSNRMKRWRQNKVASLRGESRMRTR